MSRSGIWLRAAARGYDGRRHRRRERDVYGRAIVIACVTAFAARERDGVRGSGCEGRRRDRRLPEAGQGVPPRGDVTRPTVGGTSGSSRGTSAARRGARPGGPAGAPGPAGPAGRRVKRALQARRSGRSDRARPAPRASRARLVRPVPPGRRAQGPAGPQGPAGAASLAALDGTACTRFDGAAGHGRRRRDVGESRSSFAASPAAVLRRLRRLRPRRS